jgi:hypothetical protein
VQQAGLEIVNSPIVSPRNTTPRTPNKQAQQSPSARVRDNLLLDKLPQNRKKPPVKQVKLEMPKMRTQIARKPPSQPDDKSFAKVYSQIKLLDNSQSCKLLETLKNSKPKRFKLLGRCATGMPDAHKEYMTPVAVRMRAFQETPQKLLMTCQSVQSMMSHHSSANTPLKPSREIRML